MAPLLQAALNGSRPRTEHPSIPRTPSELATEARAAVEAGAHLVHLHPYDPEGTETFAVDVCAGVLRAVREACPGVPISLTTSAVVEPDPDRRLEAIAGWTDLPDLVTANQGEPGIVELCHLLAGRGVGIEAGLLSVGDAESFARSGLAVRCVRALVEPLDPDPGDAVKHAAEIEDVLRLFGIALEQVHHGEGLASWAVNERALVRGHGIRTGLEDTTVLPDGRPASNNAELVRAAVELTGRS